jgi:hypothetical protein
MRNAQRISCTACSSPPPRRTLPDGAAVAKPDTLIVDGHAFSWQRILELRRQQLEAWEAGQPRQLALFVPHHDCRPAAERTAALRYQEPSLLSWQTGTPPPRGESRLRRTRS